MQFTHFHSKMIKKGLRRVHVYTCIRFEEVERIDRIQTVLYMFSPLHQCRIDTAEGTNVNH